MARILSAASAVSVLMAVVGAALGAQQSDRTRTEALAQRASERLRTLEQEADRLAMQERTLLGDLRKLEIERELRTEQLKQVDADVAAVQREIAAADGRVASLEQQELAARPVLRSRLAEIYKLGQGRYLRLLLATSDVRRLGEASRTVATLAELDRERFATHQRTLADLQSTRATLDTRRRRLDALRRDSAAARAVADRAARAQSERIADIDRRRDLNAQLSGELVAAQRRLQLALRDMASGRPPAPTEPTALPFKPFRGDLDWPVAGTVRRRAARGSSGIEIAAAEGTAVNAIHEGVVAFADSFPGYGNLVIVDHGGRTFSLYGELLDIGVKSGARVEHGRAVGTVGTPLTAPGQPGLYFELRVDGQAVDPLQWLKRRP